MRKDLLDDPWEIIYKIIDDVLSWFIISQKVRRILKW